MYLEIHADYFDSIRNNFLEFVRVLLVGKGVVDLLIGSWGT